MSSLKTSQRFNALLTPGKRQQINKDEPYFNKKVSLSINWIVTLLKDLLNKVNGQSELITSLVKKLATLVPRDDLEAELEKKKNNSKQTSTKLLKKSMMLLRKNSSVKMIALSWNVIRQGKEASKVT